MSFSPYFFIIFFSLSVSPLDLSGNYPQRMGSHVQLRISQNTAACDLFNTIHMDLNSLQLFPAFDADLVFCPNG